MRAFIRAVDKFCLTHRRFGIPRLMLYIIIGNAAVYLLSALDTTHTFAYFLVFDPSAILSGQVWRLVTWLFLPSATGSLGLSSLFFTALMLYFYYFIGVTLEREWGTAKFTIFYIFGFLLSIVYAFAVWLISGGRTFPMLDASYLNLSMFFAFAVLFPEQRVLLFFIIPIKIKWLALIDAAYFAIQIVAMAIAGRYWSALLPIVATLNVLLFCGDDLIRLIRPYKARSSKQAINFRKAARQKRREDSAHPYRHKCAVCGKTDAEFPNLEFRYCSRCNGYHCFCIDHINNHVHFQ
ncbi:Membrane associated serine protease, rhomboid family [Sporobacter termitidis DSM 10068]|uniref:Membrane associated serine protease, rhomboid family n=1 Tax=Sporobacter termitidis DSM 10068 TaxID=1123282 RepID=A0A1M5TL55_9FIRM|nr:rhomboid family intramembrane serine protease [Sporobacter termitidis]SHH51502.1 Membrane associated serine protease, rhomboid family [Sporobacter termitidis DSM 10068]